MNFITNQKPPRHLRASTAASELGDLQSPETPRHLAPSRLQKLGRAITAHLPPRLEKWVEYKTHKPKHRQETYSGHKKLKVAMTVGAIAALVVVGGNIFKHDTQSGARTIQSALTSTIPSHAIQAVTTRHEPSAAVQLLSEKCSQDLDCIDDLNAMNNWVESRVEDGASRPLAYQQFTTALNYVHAVEVVSDTH